MTTTADQQPSQHGVLNSLIRAVSSRKPQTDTPRTSTAAPPVPLKTPEDHPIDAELHSQTTTHPAPQSSGAASAPAHKERRKSHGYLERFKSLTTSNQRKDEKSDATTTPADSLPSKPAKEPEVQVQPAASSSKTSKAHQPLSDLSEVSELAELAAVAEEYTNPTKPTAPSAEPSALGKLIQSLIESLPPLNPNDPVPKLKPVRKGSDGKPIPPSDIVVKDPRVIAQLSSPSIMNGSTKTGKKSVWSVLEGLGPPKHETEHDPGKGAEGGVEPDDDTDSESIMLYAPLHPTNDSVVEIAMSELRPVIPTAPKSAEKVARYGFPWGSKPKPAKPTKLVQVWMPSKTKLSVEIKWWGYRLYLPPPVMASLRADATEAAKVATVITGALTWVIGHLPIEIVPVPLRPAALLLKRLAPYLAYVGAFIAWSWTTISSFDKGQGVVLSATWVLPFALIPGSWPVASAPAPAPPPKAPSPPPVAPTTPTTPAAPPTAPTPTVDPSPAPAEPTTPSEPATPASPSKPVGFIGHLFRGKTK